MGGEIEARMGTERNKCCDGDEDKQVERQKQGWEVRGTGAKMGTRTETEGIMWRDRDQTGWVARWELGWGPRGTGMGETLHRSSTPGPTRTQPRDTSPHFTFDLLRPQLPVLAKRMQSGGWLPPHCHPKSMPLGSCEGSDPRGPGCTPGGYNTHIPAV